jgi:hypothetical protein
MKEEEMNKDDFERQAHLALLTMQKQLMDEYNMRKLRGQPLKMEKVRVIKDNFKG